MKLNDKCKSCNKPIRPFLKFGSMPIANAFYKKVDFKKQYFYNMDVCFCKNCLTFQLLNIPKPSQMFHKKYAYFASTSQFMQNHWTKLAINIKKKNNSNLRKIIIDIGSNDGILLNQKISNRLSTQKNIIIICGHYKGVDQRVRDNLITMELSIGNYVLSGGELPAAVLCDSIIRLIPGVLNNETSALTDSFQDNLLAPPVYTRPSNYNNIKVPDLLLSGHKTKIEDWREKKSIEKTNKLRPEMLDE